MARIDEFVKLLPDTWLGLSGSVFFSGRRAFEEPCDLYLLGLNPAGDPAGEHTIGENAESIPRDYPENWSAWRDERWGGNAPGRNYRQRRVLHMFERVGLDPGEVPASEVIFLRSTIWRKDLGDLEPLAQRCWPFHQAVIETLGVRVIACLGKPAGNLVRGRVDAHDLVDEFVEDNKRGWKSHVHANPQGLSVVTLAHPSQVDWTAPASDPTGLVERALRRCSTDAPRASGV